MSNKLCITIFAIGLSVMFASPARGQQGTEQPSESVDQIKAEILQVEDIRNKAMLDHDTAVLSRMYSDDLSWSNPSGEVLTKTQVLADLVSGKQKFFNISHDDIRLHVYGLTVIADGRSTSTLSYKGKVSQGIARRFLNVYVKRHGQWLLVAHSQTVIADQNAAAPQ
jgi:ketosteroid isomerase-like protein